MNRAPDAAARRFVQHCRDRVAALAVCLLAVGLSLFGPSAHAADGCKVLLCLAAPSWRDISDCKPPVEETMHNLALGHPFPSCSMSGEGNTAVHQWATAPSYCPPQYAHAVETESGTFYLCDYAGAITVIVNGAPWSRTWWAFNLDSVTEFSQAAKLQLGTWSTRFDDEYAAWLASNPPSLPPCTLC